MFQGAYCDKVGNRVRKHKQKICLYALRMSCAYELDQGAVRGSVVYDEGSELGRSIPLGNIMSCGFKSNKDQMSSLR